MKTVRLFFVCGLCLISILWACTSGKDAIQVDPDKSSQTLKIGDMAITVLDAQLRKSVQTYYLMQYPDPDHTFLEVRLAIQDSGLSPTSILDWGTESIALNCEGSQAKLAFSRRIIADANVKYKVGEQIDFNYVYIYSVPQNADFNTCALVLPENQIVSLSTLIEISDYFAAPTPSKEMGSVLSGEENHAFGENAVVGGGTQNSANAIHATVSGGNLNVASTSHATISGGRENSAVDFFATVGGGYANIASARDTFIGGGSRNTASGPRSTISGGIQNQALAPDTAIAGGAYNQAADDYAFVGGGTRNLALGYASVIGGGAGNIANNDQATIAGGLVNQVDGRYSAVGGGYRNLVTGIYSTIPGGFENMVLGDYSFAAGQGAKVAAGHSGTFIYADASDVEFSSVTANEFAARATGGIRFVSAINSDGDMISGVRLQPGSGSWATLSDRSAKTGFETVNQKEILALLVDLPLSTWRYLGQAEDVRHIGPVSQDFYATFGYGEDEGYISTVDADGIALAAIQGMFEIIQVQEALIQDQESRLLEIETRLIEMEEMKGGIQKSQPGILDWLEWGLVVGIAVILIGKRWPIYPDYRDVNHDHERSQHRS